MDIERTGQQPSLSQTSSAEKVRSANRMRYEVEAQFLRQQNGDLEQIRNRLGLSKRKICQLLLVDPSAWTRWTQAGNSAPPHIYKALDWYLSILEKDPEYRRLSLRFAEWLNHEKEYSGRLARLEGQLELQASSSKIEPPKIDQKPTFLRGISAGIALGAAIAYLFLRLSHGF